MTRSEAMKLVDRIFYSAAFDRPQDGFSTVRDALYRLELASEKQFRRGRPGTAGLTAPQAARLFTVRHIAEGLEKPDRWSMADINRVRLECLKAQAWANEHYGAFLEAFGDDLPAALALDYAELMK
jgi:hypothetical protein